MALVTRIEAPEGARRRLQLASPATLEPIGEFEQSWIEVRQRDWPDSDDRLGSRVVSVIEVLSPSNKGLYGERDLRKFVGKRRAWRQ